jgi:glycosyltransferase involved in cell wall biosynthesis
VTREKGQLDLVRAAAALRREGVNCTLALAGRVDSSAFVDELKAEIAREGLEQRVLFLGNLTVEELRDWYAASAAVAFPTYHHEGLGRVIIEAQAMETPVVAYATGGVAEGIESGRTGFLLATGDVAGLTARLRDLLAAPALGASLGARGRAVAEGHFSLAALAGRHEAFYSRVIATVPDRTG